MSIPEERRKRLEESRSADWLASRMRATIDSDSTGFSAVVASRHLSDLGEAVGGVLSLSGGTIGDMLPPEFVRDAARAAVEGYPHYPGVRGYADLRRSIARKLSDENGIEADPETEILPTIGCQLAIDGAMRLLVDPGDEVLLFDPEYASTEPAIRATGGRVVRVPLSWDGERWEFDFKELASRVTPKSKLLVMSNPNNPTGIVFSREELEQIADLARRMNLWLFSDEEYEKTLFDGAVHTSIAALPGMRDRTVSGFSFSKPFAMTPYRIGYMVGPAKLMDHMYTILRFSIQACPAVGMRAAHAVLNNDMGPWLAKSTASLQAKRDYLVERLNGLEGVQCHAPQGVYFAFPDVRALGVPTLELAERAVVEARVSITPGEFYGPQGVGHLRISFCPSMEDVKEGMDRLERVLVKRAVAG